MSFEDLSEYELLFFLERLQPSDLLAICDQPISKKVAKVCNMDPKLKQKIYDLGMGLIEKAWENIDETTWETIHGDSKAGIDSQIKFTGNPLLDGYLTLMGQNTDMDDLFEPTPIPPEYYKESLLYKYYTMDRSQLYSMIQRITIRVQVDEMYNDNLIEAINLVHGVEGDIKSLGVWEAIAIFAIFYGRH